MSPLSQARAPARIAASGSGDPYPKISRGELRAATLYCDADVWVVNKPAWLVCHPSKDGDWSSLVGAARQFLGQDAVHPVSRLDRETSGVVVVARNPKMGALLQGAMARRAARKTYVALLTGHLRRAATVDLPIGPARGAPVAVMHSVGEGEGFSPACTRFEPLYAAGGFTLCRVYPLTGRTHQIRVHACALGYPIAGDKLYGPDAGLYLEFVERGWTPRHESALFGLRRQALHAEKIAFDLPKFRREFRAPLARELRVFALERMGAGVLGALRALC